MILEEGGSFVAKFFYGNNWPLLKSQLEVYFSEVYCFKPTSSRIGSAEHFLVCKNFKSVKEDDKYFLEVIDPFLKNGDLSGFDN
jgi:23S rRNA U2552 (ribose-2'-O)-methylase RlmE/FtsJ